MELLAAVLLAGACAAIGALALRHRRREPGVPAPLAEQGEEGGEPPPTEPARDQLEQLHVQDLVLYDGMELTVAAVARCEERDLRWAECRLVDAGVERWLLLRPEDPDAAVVGQRIEDLGVGPAPSESVEHAGQVYRLERCGHARLASEGDLGGSLVDGECGYWDYRRPGPDRIWIRRSGGASASFAGQRVGRHLITVLPGS